VDAIVTISGGGIIGNYISSRLNNLNIKCVVVEKNQKVFSTESNIRTLTLNPISKKLLDDIGIEVPSAAIKEISVFDAEGSGKIVFDASEINHDNLSYVVFFDDLLQALQESEHSKIIFDNEIININEDTNEEFCEVLLKSKDVINTTFVAGCDGRNSNVAKITGQKSKRSDYNQTAITFTTISENIDEGRAFQIFSERGIFAAMPLPKNDHEATHTIVWSINNSKLKDQTSIEEYVSKNIHYFEKKLNTQYKICSDLISFKLSNHYFENYISSSTVLIGDAAHSIHPLAGQGINLGFADADVFCEEIINSYNKTRKINKNITLKRYEIRRKKMNLLMLKSMDFFVELFKSQNLLLILLRNIGLSGVNKIKFLKTFFINHASGNNKL
jgi:2-octaprenylphenol hydroxylase